jgi:hypothetical protein
MASAIKLHEAKGAACQGWNAVSKADELESFFATRDISCPRELRGIVENRSACFSRVPLLGVLGLPSIEGV